ncbi:MAG: GerAB/ArcD/ProY family transporter [Bacillota bacterium]
MSKEVISDKQGIFMMVLFLSGSTSIFVSGIEAKKDSWIAIIVAVIMVFPMLLLFARLHHLYPDKDLFDIFEICFGKIIGKVLMIIFTWYTFYWAADVINNFVFFIMTVSFPETPRYVLIICLTALCAWGVRAGIEVLGKWANLFLVVVIVGLSTTVAMLIPDMKLSHILPVFQEGMKPIIKGAYSVFTQPFVQTVAFTMFFRNLERKTSSYKIYITGLLIGAAVSWVVSITNVLAIGAKSVELYYYPTYQTYRKINIGEFLQRVEVVIAAIFMFGGFIKISILSLCTCKGITRIFGWKEYRWIVTPIALLIMNMAYIEYSSVQEYFGFNTDIWPNYFMPFQIILPIITWAIAEIKNRQSKQRTIEG